jgi:hypothetical protein
VEKNRARMTEEEEDKLIQKLIEEKIHRFANNGIEFYGGVCIDVDRRLSIHLNEHKHKKGFNRLTLDCVPLITCVSKKTLVLNDSSLVLDNIQAVFEIFKRFFKISKNAKKFHKKTFYPISRAQPQKRTLRNLISDFGILFYSFS